MNMIRTLGLLLGLASVITGLTGFGPAARADEWDKTTKVTFKEPVQVPGTDLPAGTYVFRLMDSPAERHIVQIYNEDHTKLITTIMAIANERLEPAGKTILLYDERPADQPVALAAWFYPGDNIGQEFVYPKSRAEELSRLNKREVPSSGSDQGYTAKSESSAEPVTHPRADVRPSTPETSSATQPEPAPAPRATPPPSPAPAPTTAQSAPPANPPHEARPLPQTASSLPLVGLVSLTLLGAALVLRLALRS